MVAFDLLSDADRAANIYNIVKARLILAGNFFGGVLERYSASKVPVSCSRRTQYPISQSIRETTMNVFEPISMYRRNIVAHSAGSVLGHDTPV